MGMNDACAGVDSEAVSEKVLQAHDSLVRLGWSEVAAHLLQTNTHYQCKLLKQDVLQKKRSWRSHQDPIYQECRGPLIDWMAQVCDVCRLKPITLHTSVVFLDTVLDMYPVAKTRLQLVGLCCVFISAKIEEQEDRVPRISRLNYCSANAFSQQLICQMECLILNTLHWDTVIVTPYHFLEYYSVYSLHSSEQELHGASFPATKAYLDKFSSFFLELSLQHSVFREFLPSITAAAAIACARTALNMRPAWSPALSHTSGYQFSEVESCINALWEAYQRTFPQAPA